MKSFLGLPAVLFSILGDWGRGGGVDTSPFKLTVIDQVSGKNLQPQSLDICFFVDIAFGVYSTLFIQITFH